MNAPFKQKQMAGETIAVGSYEIAPIARQIDMRSGRIPLWLRWTSPTAVRLRHPDGQIEHISIPDPTRQIQIGLFLGVVGMSIVMLLGRLIAGKGSSAHS